jgi:hypothetical protein
MSAQMRHLARLMDDGKNAAAKGDISGLAHSWTQAMEKTAALGMGGAATTLTFAAFNGTLKQSLEDWGNTLWEAAGRALGGSVSSQILESAGVFSRDNKGTIERLARLNLPMSVAMDVGGAAVKAVETRVPGKEVINTDPIIQMLYSQAPAARLVRDAMGMIYGLETGEHPASRRKAITTFYEFARKHPEFMSRPADQVFASDATPYTELIRRISKRTGFIMSPTEKADIYRSAGLLGKTPKEIAKGLRAKRLVEDFKKDYRPIALQFLGMEHGPENARELARYDAMLDFLADQIDPR